MLFYVEVKGQRGKSENTIEQFPMESACGHVDLDGVEFDVSRKPVRMMVEMDISKPRQNVKCYMYHFKHYVIN